MLALQPEVALLNDNVVYKLHTSTHTQVLWALE